MTFVNIKFLHIIVRYLLVNLIKMFGASVQRSYAWPLGPCALFGSGFDSETVCFVGLTRYQLCWLSKENFGEKWWLKKLFKIFEFWSFYLDPSYKISQSVIYSITDKVSVIRPIIIKINDVITSSIIYSHSNVST